MLRVGELAVEENWRSLCDDMKDGGVDDAEVPKGGVPRMAVVGRDIFCEAAFSFSRVRSAIATMRLAMPSKTSVILTKAFVALRQSRPAIAMSAYVRFAPRERGSCRRKTYAIVYPATGSPNIMGPEGLLDGRTSVDNVRMQVRRSRE